MKINIGKLLRIAGRVIIAAPAVIEAVRPVLGKPSRSKNEPATGPNTPPPAGGGPLGAP